MLVRATLEDITPRKLSDLLRLCGSDLPAIKAVNATPLDGGNGYMAQSYRLAVEWDRAGAGAPRTLVAKLPLPGIFPEPQPDMRRMFRREAMFHRVVAPSAPLRTAKTQAAHIDPETGASILIFEDLSWMRPYRDDESLTVEQVEACLADLAALHAKYWLSAELQAMDWLGWPRQTKVDEPSQEDFFNGWPKLVASGAYELSPAQLHLGEALRTKMGAVYEVLHAAPETVIHTDLHQENIFFDGPRPAFIDWQLAERSPGAKDVAKLTASCLPPALVAPAQPELIRGYHRELERHGVTGYALEQLTAHVHLATCHYISAMLFLGDNDFEANARLPGPRRSDFTTQRVLAAAGRDEVIAAVEAL
jgi:hypothetical protein